ncbi:hypothetical protein Ais01nite_71300 [Asanoa ishikariensis]|uniref:Glyoxalase-like domain-containing protein n=2 Tax=Asanoa ishikariensis TaxID=137265 RepID=A0A1H3UPC8_9ACTN|nr:hypothetical protein Ais01nite_71300 [Asanoa ishikariensis]SDZ64096.1 hypothetical protein SAMN05421684_7665 [Asanoa ishikariensis]
MMTAEPIRPWWHDPKVITRLPRMTSRVGDIVIDCADPELLAAFWSGVLGYRIFARDETGVAIRGATVSPDILFIRVPEVKSAKNRLHFDVCPTDGDQAQELDRLLALGARRSPIQAGGSWVVLEDPEGNEFCLMAKRIAAEPEPFHEP